MNFIFEQIENGGERNFGYIIGCRESKQCLFVDPSYRPEVYIERANCQNLSPVLVLNTHGHHDHINGNEFIQNETGAKIAISNQSSIPHDIGLEDAQELSIGKYSIQTIATPGHSIDHMVFAIPKFSIAITGDHLFVGKIGGTADKESAQLQFNSFKRLFQILSDNTTVWPGHHFGCRPSSTVFLEKRCNPFLLKDDFSYFWEMKQKWSTYKMELGLK